MWGAGHQCDRGAGCGGEVGGCFKTTQHGTFYLTAGWSLLSPSTRLQPLFRPPTFMPVSSSPLLPSVHPLGGLCLPGLLPQADNFLFEAVDEEDQEGEEGEVFGVDGDGGGEEEEEEEEEEEFVDLDDM